MKRIGISFLVILLFNSCSINEPTPTIHEGKETIGNYFESLKKKDYQNIFNLYATDFFEHISPSEWLKELQKLDAYRGELVRANLMEYTINKDVNVTNIVLVYDVLYQNTSATETFTVITNPTRILGHDISFYK